MASTYHVFISSTRDDLKNERAALARIVFELGHIPILMDGFDQADKKEWRIIKKNISESDYFLSLTAHRYGLREDGKSGIEAEYAQAAAAGIPVIALIIGEKARWKASKREDDEGMIRSLEEFKRKLQVHPHAFWSNLQELERNARGLLLEELFLNPRKGWVPADQRIHPRVANEMARLLGENGELKKQLLLGSDNGSRWQVQVKHTLEMMAVNKISLSFFYAPGENWENTITCRYLRLFKLLVPELYVGKTTSELSRFLGSILNPDLTRTVRKDYPTPSNTIKKIMADFNLLKLVHFSGGAGEEIWELAEFGKELYAAYRRRQFERGLKAAGAKAIAQG
ncbi:MAG: DUF4062 domain-containing protein [Spirochaetaceae bacterium]|jgi:hypothetical protein|nr:DUF4062 domain-containing protein [Spirochaetaceae bacterium]